MQLGLLHLIKYTSNLFIAREKDLRGSQKNKKKKRLYEREKHFPYVYKVHANQFRALEKYPFEYAYRQFYFFMPTFSHSNNF
jgi:hypothetical protein